MLAARRAAGQSVRDETDALVRRSPDLARVVRGVLAADPQALADLLPGGPDGPIARERRLLEAEARIPTAADLAVAKAFLERPEARAVVAGAVLGMEGATHALRAESP